MSAQMLFLLIAISFIGGGIIWSQIKSHVENSWDGWCEEIQAEAVRKADAEARDMQFRLEAINKRREAKGYEPVEDLWRV